MTKIEIDGKSIDAPNGKMIIEVADEAGIYIPRFCYHKKLSIAANCRMCLVEVENGRKPVPACATPISEGMKVFTNSNEAIKSQKAVMEFLLINHPLDCPICDQGGECELQDLSMGFGSDASIYEETKRSFADDDLGPLIGTAMTRCIQCTRCVRFGEEIAGIKELGATSRGEAMQIGTYVEHSMVSELSGNIIDLCPVGALTSKPFAFKARPWELDQHDSIAPHDCIGSNVHLHVRREELLRVVPKENESINETWLSDRDRFSYLGLNSNARANEPLIKRNGQWESVDWQTALNFAVVGIKKTINDYGPEQFAAFAAPSSTTEECYLLQKLMRELGVNNLDHRLHQVDFRDQESLPVTLENSLAYECIEKQSQVLLIGCNIHREVPLAGVRVRKAASNGAKISAINPIDFDYHFELDNKLIVHPDVIPDTLAQMVKVLGENQKLPAELTNLIKDVAVNDNVARIVENLKQENSLIITGALFENHPEAALLRTFLYWIKKLSNVKTISLTFGANSNGASLTGMVPHHSPDVQQLSTIGLDIQKALQEKLKGYLLMALEPGYDCANPYIARRAMLAAEFVVCLSAYENDSIKEYADVILPIAPFAETSGTYINIDNQWQTFAGAKKPYAQSRPAWKVLRVLGNLFNISGFEYNSTEEILHEIKLKINLLEEKPYTPFYPDSLPKANGGLVRVGEWPLYRVDSIVRHAEALQNCAAAEKVVIKMHPETANKYKLDDAATISQSDIEITLPLVLDERIAINVIWIPNALSETQDLGHSFATVNISSNG